MESPADSGPQTEAHSPRVTKDTDLTGRTLGDFQLLRRIGQGGMGQVYLATQVSLKRQVAVKILRTDLAANETALKRFRLEAEAVARINHANIVQVYACSEQDGINYMALEYVDGRNLREHLLKKGPPELPLALSMMRQVTAALQRAFESGIVHRDIKPENILISRKGEVKVADFGLSRCFDVDEGQSITASGVTMGTPLYMSPEQVQGHVVDPRSDIYSFGVTCYHLLTGEPLFQGATSFEVALQHVQATPVPLQQKRPDLPPDLCAMVMKMLAKQPNERYQSPREILRELARLREGRPTTAMTNSSPSTPIPTLPATAPRRLSSWAIALIAAGLLATGLAIGAMIRQSTTDRTTESPSELPVESESKTRREPIASPRERELREQLDSLRPEPQRRMELNIELALLYLSEGRLDDADRIFRATSAPGRTPVKINELGAAIVMAYRDSQLPDAPTKSNELFLKSLETLLKNWELPPMPTVKEKLGFAKDKFAPILTFRNSFPFEVTRAAAKALERNAVNLREQKQSMPPRLEQFRRMLAYPLTGVKGTN